MQSAALCGQEGLLLRLVGIVDGVNVVQDFLCHFWFNSGFIDPKEMKLHLVKSTIDVANKDRKQKVFRDDFAIEAYFKYVK